MDIDNETSQRAVSLYGQNEGVDDFPVLKAFQQYIDAEQEKARKRILSLGIFFGVILIVVIAVFLFLLNGINMRNQALSDRLVEYAMKESDRRQNAQPSAAVSPQNDAFLKAMTESLISLQKKIDGDNSNQGTDDQKERAVDEKIAKAKALLDVEKQKLAVERERLHNIEIEQQRRRLYPDLYEDGEPRYNRNRKSRTSRADLLTDEDIREIIREADAVSEPIVKTQKKKTKPSIGTSKVLDDETESEKPQESDDDAIEYFSDDDYTIPVDVKVKGSSSRVNFTVPYE